MQNVRDFPQTKLDNRINSPFLLNEHGDPRFFFEVFAKNSLVKNIFKEEKKFNSRTCFFFRKIVPNWVYFGQGEDLKLATELSEKVQYSRNQAIKNMKLYFQVKTLCLSNNQDLIPYGGDSNF